MKQTLLESKTQQNTNQNHKRTKSKLHQNPNFFLPNIQNKEKASTTFLTKPKSK